jgi:hypothetical protein
MMATPDWISLVAPFISGAFGVGVTWGILAQKLKDLERRLLNAETEIKHQVVEDHCEKYRDKCSNNICNMISELKADFRNQSEWSRAKIDELVLLLMKR